MSHVSFSEGLWNDAVCSSSGLEDHLVGSGAGVNHFTSIDSDLDTRNMQFQDTASKDGDSRRASFSEIHGDAVDSRALPSDGTATSVSHHARARKYSQNIRGDSDSADDAVWHSVPNRASGDSVEFTNVFPSVPLDAAPDEFDAIDFEQPMVCRVFQDPSACAGHDALTPPSDIEAAEIEDGGTGDTRGPAVQQWLGMVENNADAAGRHVPDPVEGVQWGDVGSPAPQVAHDFQFAEATICDASGEPQPGPPRRFERSGSESTSGDDSPCGDARGGEGLAFGTKKKVRSPASPGNNNTRGPFPAAEVSEPAPSTRHDSPAPDPTSTSTALLPTQSQGSGQSVARATQPPSPTPVAEPAAPTPLPVRTTRHGSLASSKDSHSSRGSGGGARPRMAPPAAPAGAGPPPPAPHVGGGSPRRAPDPRRSSLVSTDSCSSLGVDEVLARAAYFVGEHESRRSRLEAQPPPRARDLTPVPAPSSPGRDAVPVAPDPPFGPLRSPEAAGPASPAVPHLDLSQTARSLAGDMAAAPGSPGTGPASAATRAAARSPDGAAALRSARTRQPSTGPGAAVQTPSGSFEGSSRGSSLSCIEQSSAPEATSTSTQDISPVLTSDSGCSKAPRGRGQPPQRQRSATPQADSWGARDRRQERPVAKPTGPRRQRSATPPPASQDPRQRSATPPPASQDVRQRRQRSATPQPVSHASATPARVPQGQDPTPRKSAGPQCAGGTGGHKCRRAPTWLCQDCVRSYCDECLELVHLDPAMQGHVHFQWLPQRSRSASPSTRVKTSAAPAPSNSRAAGKPLHPSEVDSALLNVTARASVAVHAIQAQRVAALQIARQARAHERDSARCTRRASVEAACAARAAQDAAAVAHAVRRSATRPLGLGPGTCPGTAGLVRASAVAAEAAKQAASGASAALVAAGRRNRQAQKRVLRSAHDVETLTAQIRAMRTVLDTARTVRLVEDPSDSRGCGGQAMA